MERWVGKVAVVTGASAGIGANLCENLVKHGLKVVGLARRVERVDDIAKKLSGEKGKLHSFKCDVSNKQDVTNAFKWIKDNIGPVAILVNNAGIFRQGMFADGDVNDWQKVVDTNIIGLAQCSQEAIKQMREANIVGHVVHIGSVAGHFQMSGDPPSFNMYSPTKFAVRTITEIMRKEMAHLKTNIRITVVSPGVVETDIGAAAGVEGYDSGFYKTQPHLKPQDVSEAVIYVLGTPQHVNVHDFIIRQTAEVFPVK